MRKTFFILIFSLILSSCYNQSQNKPISNGNVDNKGFSISLNNENITNYSFLKSAKFIFLANDFPIAQIDRLLFYGDTIVVLDRKEQSIFTFRSDGTFVSRICKSGRGPGEYTNLDDIAINYETGNILVLDRSTQRILIYDFDGVFQNGYNLEWGLFDRITYLDKFIYLQNSSSKYYPPQQNKTYHALLRYDLKTTDMTGYFSNSNPYSHLAFDNKAFYYNGKELFYNDRFSFDVYKVKTIELTKLFSVIFSNNNNYYDYAEKISNINDLLNTQFAFDIRDLCVSANYISFKYTKERKTFYVVYNRKTKKVVLHNNQSTLASIELITQKSILAYSHPEYANNGQFIATIQPSMLKDLFERIIINNPPSAIKEAYGKIKNMNLYDNPILIFYEFLDQ